MHQCFGQVVLRQIEIFVIFDRPLQAQEKETGLSCSFYSEPQKYDEVNEKNHSHVSHSLLLLPVIAVLLLCTFIS